MFIRYIQQYWKSTLKVYINKLSKDRHWDDQFYENKKCQKDESETKMYNSSLYTYLEYNYFFNDLISFDGE